MTDDSPRMSLRFDTDVQFIKGVGPKLGDLLHRRGISRVIDLLEYFPRAYEDRRAVRQIKSLVPDQLVSIKARILSVRSMPMGKSSRRIWDVVIGDESGRISCKYFRVPYKGYFERFDPHQEVRVVGKVTNYRGRLEFHHPDLHAAAEEEEFQDQLIPIYPEIEGQSSAKLGRLIRNLLALNPEIPETLPEGLRTEHGLMPLAQALREIHAPPLAEADQFLNFAAPSQRRLIFDEFFLIELHLGAPQKATTASPTNLSMVPPLRSTTALIVSRYLLRRKATISAGMAWLSLVKPSRSLKRA